MSGSLGSSNISAGYSDEGYHEKFHIEPIYKAFICPLTKRIMTDPVSIENGYSFEREAIEKWFRECVESGRKLLCPATFKELKNTETKPSIALQSTIEEWTMRNESAQLENARRSLSHSSEEGDVLQSLDYVAQFCQKSRLNKHALCNAEMLPSITNMLKSSDRRVRLKSLKTLRVIAEEADDSKEAINAGDTIRTIVKFLSHEHPNEREEAVSLLYELSKSEVLCESIGAVSGSILMLVGMASSKSENICSVEKAEKTLENLEKYEKNVRQLAENGRLQPLLTLLLNGSPEIQFPMAAYLGEIAMSNDVKVFVAQSAGSRLVSIMKTGSMQAREAALKALNQISSCEGSAKILLHAGILPPLVKDLFTLGIKQVPLKLKEMSAMVLANIVASGSDFETFPLGSCHQTLVSEDIVHNLLHLISNTGPAIGCNLLQVLVGLTSSSATAKKIVSAIKSSGATISLIQFVEAPQEDLRIASLKLLHNISLYMSQELAFALCGNPGQLRSLVKVISDDNGISEEQTTAIGVLANLPERDSSLTRRLSDEGTFSIIINRLTSIQQGETRSNRFITSFLEGIARVLSRLTYILHDEPEGISLAREHNLVPLFTDLLQMNGLDKVQIVAAMSLENLSKLSKHLTKTQEVPRQRVLLPASGCFGKPLPMLPCLGKPLPVLSRFDKPLPCFSKPPVTSGLCRVHRGICSPEASFCLLEGKALAKLIACLDHPNENLVEASLAALCTLLDDAVDIKKGVLVLHGAGAIKPILDILLENRNDILHKRAVWAVERILRSEDIAFRIAGDQKVGTALVEAFRHGDYKTKHIAERALQHVDKLPHFSGIFTNAG